MAAPPTLRDRDTGSPVEVSVYRFGLFMVHEWCEPEDDAEALVPLLTATGGARCELRRRSV
jgi:hypothetical protein